MLRPDPPVAAQRNPAFAARLILIAAVDPQGEALFGQDGERTAAFAAGVKGEGSCVCEPTRNGPGQVLGRLAGTLQAAVGVQRGVARPVPGQGTVQPAVLRYRVKAAMP